MKSILPMVRAFWGRDRLEEFDTFWYLEDMRRSALVPIEFLEGPQVRIKYMMHDWKQHFNPNTARSYGFYESSIKGQLWQILVGQMPVDDPELAYDQMRYGMQPSAFFQSHVARYKTRENFVGNLSSITFDIRQVYAKRQFLYWGSGAQYSHGAKLAQEIFKGWFSDRERQSKRYKDRILSANAGFQRWHTVFAEEDS